MRFNLFLVVMLVGFLPVCAQAAPASVPFWINSADAYAHYTLDRTDYFETGRHVFQDTGSTFYGDSGLTAVTSGSFNSITGAPNWQYQLYIENFQNPGYDYSTRTEDERIYLWVEYTYFRPEGPYTSGGLSYSHPSGTDVWNNLAFSETRVDADLNYATGPIFTSEISGNDGNAPGTYETYAYMFGITSSQHSGNAGWSWENYIQWRTDDDVYLSEVYTATISFQNYTAASVPVPGALLLLGTGLIGLIGTRRRFR